MRKQTPFEMRCELHQLAAEKNRIEWAGFGGWPDKSEKRMQLLVRKLKRIKG